MAAIYHLKVKKEYAAALIEDLIKSDAVEKIATENTEIPQWQMDALDKELQNIAENSNYTISWESVKGNFNQP